jgi:hypothetical protein
MKGLGEWRGRVRRWLLLLGKGGVLVNCDDVEVLHFEGIPKNDAADTTWEG